MKKKYLIIIIPLVLCFLASWLVLRSEDIEDFQENIDEITHSDNSRGGKNTLDRSEYGIVFDYNGFEIDENFTVNNESIEIIDCRKMSSSLRESLTDKGNNECYQVMISLDDESYIVIRTGNGYYTDPAEQSIKSDSDVFKEFPTSKVNLPQDRITIADFPTNLIGTKVTYESGEEHVFHKGIVYKGADKYAITIRGELGEKLISLIKDVELE